MEKKLSQVFFIPFIIFGFPDEKLGKKISIVFEGKTPYNFEKLIKTLDSFERPKKVFNLKVFPRNNNKLLRKKIINEILNTYEPN